MGDEFFVDPVVVAAQYESLVKAMAAERASRAARLAQVDESRRGVEALRVASFEALARELYDARGRDAAAACLEYRRRLESAELELRKQRQEMRAMDGQIESLLAMTPGHDTCVVFDKGDVRRDDLSLRARSAARGGKPIVVARFPKSSGPSPQQQQQQEHAAATSDEVDRLQAALAAQSAAYDAFRARASSAAARSEAEAIRRERAALVEAARLADRLAQATSSLLESRDELFETRARLERAQALFARDASLRDQSTAELRARLEFEGLTARRALKCEIDAALSDLTLERDAARRLAEDRKQRLASSRDKHKAETSKLKGRIRQLTAELRALAKRRALETEGFQRHIAELENLQVNKASARPWARDFGVHRVSGDGEHT